ncbi:MAG TPA: hypothetical protein VHK27_05480 [Gammaproteobacteria bacterium]|nr:hypothetical protein [Gammaproteobacteria bacterium]
MNDQGRFFTVQRVERKDAGGVLFAPVDQFGVESGDTPSYDGEAIQRRCNELNGVTHETDDGGKSWHYVKSKGAPAEKVYARSSAHATKTYCWGAIMLPMMNGHRPYQLWFKTRTEAKTYAKAEFEQYAIAKAEKVQ